MSQVNKKDALLLKASKILIKDGETPVARAILQTLDHPQAKDWLNKLGKPQPARSSRFLAGGLLAGVLICLIIGFSIGRASVSPASQSAPQNDDTALFNFTDGDYQTATAIVEQSFATATAIQATRATNSAYGIQSETAQIQTVTQMWAETREALATWSAGQTATQAARNN